MLIDTGIKWKSEGFSGVEFLRFWLEICNWDSVKFEADFDDIINCNDAQNQYKLPLIMKYKLNLFLGN